MEKEKRFIPGTDPDWERELPEGFDNSLVDKNGNNWDNGFNYDEPSDDENGQEEDAYGEDQ